MHTCAAYQKKKKKINKKGFPEAQCSQLPPAAYNGPSRQSLLPSSKPAGSTSFENVSDEAAADKLESHYINFK